MFKVGDRVKHKRHTDCLDSLGTIVQISVFGDYDRFWVRWDKGSKLQQKISRFSNLAGLNSHEKIYLNKVEEFMPYDPTQQGDTEDDI